MTLDLAAIERAAREVRQMDAIAEAARTADLVDSIAGASAREYAKLLNRNKPHIDTMERQQAEIDRALGRGHELESVKRALADIGRIESAADQLNDLIGPSPTLREMLRQEEKLKTLTNPPVLQAYLKREEEWKSFVNPWLDETLRRDKELKALATPLFSVGKSDLFRDLIGSAIASENTFRDVFESTKRANELFDSASPFKSRPVEELEIPKLLTLPPNPIHETNERLAAVEKQIQSTNDGISELGKAVSKLTDLAAENAKQTSRISQQSLRTTYLSVFVGLVAAALAGMQYLAQVSDSEGRTRLEERVEKVEKLHTHAVNQANVLRLENEKLKAGLNEQRSDKGAARN